MLLSIIFFVYTIVVNMAMGEKKEKGSDKDAWLTKSGSMSETLLNVQAYIIKDSNDRSQQCKTIKGTLNTSHNIKGTLAAIIGPFATSTQVIQVEKHYQHPEFVSDPKDEKFTKYNIGLIKLYCGIDSPQYSPVYLPDKPLYDLCSDDTCAVAIVSQSSQLTFSIRQVNAKNINGERMERQISQDINFSKKIARNIIFNGDDMKHSLQINENKSALKTFDVMEKDNKHMTLNANYSKYTKSITRENRDTSRDEFLRNSVTAIRKKGKKLSTRASDGSRGCALTGTAVMSNNVQAGLVALGCDDRQPERSWIYTSLYESLSWIDEITNKTSRTATDEGDCKTCSYNFYFGHHPTMLDCLTGNYFPHLHYFNPCWGHIHTKNEDKNSRATAISNMYETGSMETVQRETKDSFYGDNYDDYFFADNNKFYKNNANRAFDPFANNNLEKFLDQSAYLHNPSRANERINGPYDSKNLAIRNKNDDFSNNQRNSDSYEQIHSLLSHYRNYRADKEIPRNFDKNEKYNKINIDYDALAETKKLSENENSKENQAQDDQDDASGKYYILYKINLKPEEKSADKSV